MTSQFISGGTLRLGVLAFVGAAALDALATILVSVGLLAFPMITRAVALGIVAGLAELGVVVVLLLPMLKSGSADVVAEVSSPRGFIAVILLGFAAFIGGVELIAFGAVLPGVTEVVGVIMGFLVYFIKFRSSLPISRNDLVIAVLTIVSAVFLAIAGFSGAGNLLATHLGVAAVALMVASIALLIKVYGGGAKAFEAVVLTAAITFSVAILVGGGLGLWGAAGVLRIGGAVAAGAAVEVIAGILGIIAGIMFLIEALKKVGKLLKAACPAPQAPATTAPATPTPPPPPPS